MKSLILLLMVNIYLIADPSFLDLKKMECQQGIVETCNKLGNLYEHGLNGVKKDYKRAFHYYQDACNKDFYLACSNLGYFYQQGYGTQTNIQKAHEFYKKACDHKVAKGCYNLGLLYRDGIGIKQNYAEARSLFDYACQNGAFDACTHIGVMYEDGLGVETDKTMAMTFYNTACDNNNSIGCHNLGLLYIYFKKDKEKALSLFEKGCTLEYQDSCKNQLILSQRK